MATSVRTGPQPELAARCCGRAELISELGDARAATRDVEARQAALPTEQCLPTLEAHVEVVGVAVAWGATVRGTCGTPEAATRTVYVQ